MMKKICSRLAPLFALILILSLLGPAIAEAGSGSVVDDEHTEEVSQQVVNEPAPAQNAAEPETPAESTVPSEVDETAGEPQQVVDEPAPAQDAAEPEAHEESTVPSEIGETAGETQQAVNEPSPAQNAGEPEVREENAAPSGVDEEAVEPQPAVVDPIPAQNAAETESTVPPESEQQEEGKPADEITEPKEVEISEEKGKAEESENEQSAPQKQKEEAASGIQKNEKEPATGSVEAAVPEQTNGSIRGADGKEKSSKSKHLELFVASSGNGEYGDGSIEAPFSSLANALESVSDDYTGVDICLLTDLEIERTVHVIGKKVSLSSYDGVVTLSRDENFDAGQDNQETALIAVGDPESEEGIESELIIEYVVIDEAGQKHDPLQDAIIEVYDGGKLILGEEAVICNYGGNAAIHGLSGSEIFVSSSGRVADTIDIPADGTVAVNAEEGCDYGREEGSVVLAHGESIFAGNTEENNEPEAKTTEETEIAEAEETETGDLLLKIAEKTETEVSTDSAASEAPEEIAAAEDNNTAKEDSVKEDSDTDETKKTETLNAAEVLQDTAAAVEVLEAGETGALSASALPSQEPVDLPLSATDDAPSLTDTVLGLTDATPGLMNISYALDAPERLSLDDSQETIGAARGYPVPYTLALNLSIPDSLISLMQAAGDAADIDIKIDLALAEKLIPETQSGDSTTALITTNFKVLKVTKAVYSGHVIQIELKPGENWLANLQELKNSLELSLRTILPTSSYAVGEILTSSASVTEMTFRYGGESRTVTPNETTVSAETKLLGAKRATLVYDPNGGTGGPGEQLLPAEVNHVLETSDVPTHADANGRTVLFLGWTLEKDHKIYADGDTAPDTVTTVTLEDYQTVMVYAVYSYDRNKDGIPDVNQKLITLGFDANGGENAPGSMIQAARALGTAEFAIPEQEPNRRYYTFLGWNEDENATEGKYKHDAVRLMNRDVTIREDTVLYAVWEENPIYTLYFNGNGGTDVPAPQSAHSEKGVAELTITMQIPTRSGRTFVGWATERYGAASFDPGEDVRLTGGDVTLYAVWERNSRWSTDGAPKTGDESNVGLYAALAIGSAGAVVVLWRVLKKRKK